MTESQEVDTRQQPVEARDEKGKVTKVGSRRWGDGRGEGGYGVLIYLHTVGDRAGGRGGGGMKTRQESEGSAASRFLSCGFYTGAFSRETDVVEIVLCTRPGFYTLGTNYRMHIPRFHSKCFGTFQVRLSA